MRPATLGARLLFSAALLFIQVITLTVVVDTASLHNPTGLARVAADAAPALRAIVLGMVLSALFVYLENRSRIEESLASAPLVSPVVFCANLAAFAAFGCFALRLFSPQNRSGGGDLLSILCVSAALAMLLSAALVFMPLRVWRRMLRANPLAPFFAFLMAAAVMLLVEASRLVWLPWMRLTYHAVTGGLALVRSGMITDSSTFLVGTERFSVIISPACSGYEGIALILVFGSAWLWFFRREFRFPRALVLLPVGVAAMWVLNCARIIALILLGDAGEPAIAAGGFHSEAGWISFVILASGLVLTSRSISWLRVRGSSQRTEHPNETAAYLTPFLVTLAAGMVAHAASAGFEWAYPQRVVAAAVSLWWFRKTYARLKWRVGWEAGAAGVLAFAVWMAVERTLAPYGVQASRMPGELAGAAGTLRMAWLMFRVVGGVVTVPLAEELAFRGYVLRRMEAADFAAVKLSNVSILPVAASSLLFGLMHGRRWIAGTLAGALYAIAARKRGSLGDAVAAHALTNALLALWVWQTGDWTLW